MTFNTFASGVNTTFSTQLNQNFKIGSYGFYENNFNEQIDNALKGVDFIPDSASYNLRSLSLSESNISNGIVSTLGGFSCESSTLPTGQTISSAYVHYDYAIHTQLDEAGITATNSTTTGTVDLSGQYFISFAYGLSVNDGNSSYLFLTDGVSDVLLDEVNDADSSRSGFMQMWIDWVNKRVIITRHTITRSRASAGAMTSVSSTSSTSAYSISGFTSLKFRVQGTAAACSASVVKVRGLKLTPSSTITLKASSDNGANYTTLSNNPDVVTFGTASSNLKFQFSGYLASSTEIIELSRVHFKLLG